MSTEPEFIAYGHTPDLKNFVKSYTRALRKGNEPPGANGQPQPRVPSRGKFFGMVKLHGTNTTIVFRKAYRNAPLTTATHHFQSRNRNIDATTDNCGTVAHLSQAPLIELVNQIMEKHNANVTVDTEWTEILVVGETAGHGIQKGVAIAHVPRLFAIFNIRIDGEWVDMRQFKDVALKEHRIFNLAAWPTYEMDIDFEKDDLHKVQTKLMELTDEVVLACPVGLALQAEVESKVAGRGPPQTGEGVVWTMVESLDENVQLDRHVLSNFKVKGEAFSTTKKLAPASPADEAAFTTTKKPAPPPPADELAKTQAFADYALGERRFEQGIEFVQDHLVKAGKADESPYQKCLTSTFTRWVVDDAMREEEVTWMEMGVKEQRARMALFNVTKAWFHAKCDAV